MEKVKVTAPRGLFRLTPEGVAKLEEAGATVTPVPDMPGVFQFSEDPEDFKARWNNRWDALIEETNAGPLGPIDPELFQMSPENQAVLGVAKRKPLSEADPSGKHQNEPGAKLDKGKVRAALVLGGFARALWGVAEVGTYGATKYTPNGWIEVPNGPERYDDAKVRHWLLEKMGEEVDAETELIHAKHEAWNALARLDRLLRERS